MKRKFFFLLALLSIFSLMFGQTITLAQTPQPPEQPESPNDSEKHKSKDRTPGYRHEIKFDGSMPESFRPLLRSQRISPQDIGGPDDFGYIWDDSALYSWKVGQPIYPGPSGDDETLFVDIGFDFKFYENTYNQVYISTNGILVFDRDDAGCCGGYPMPSPGLPNNVISPYWDDLTVGEDYNNGSIIYFNIPTATENLFVVEWDKVTDCCSTGAIDYKTFQVILYDNGNILMQYADMNGYLDYASTGIEDSFGADGLQYRYTVANNKAILFTRPSPSARVQIFPQYFGTFTKARGQASFNVPIRNTGELGVDTYDLVSTSSWAVSLFGSDGSTPLTDTDGDGILDTGPVPQAGSTTVVAKVKTPSAAQVGDDNSAMLTATSSLDDTKSKTATLQSAVPTNFAQVYRDKADGAMSFYLVTPEKQTLNKPSGDSYYGYEMAVAEMPGFAYLWNRYFYFSQNNVYTSDIEFTLLDENGKVSQPVSKLTDNSAATMDTYDEEPVTAVTPSGQIGVAWRRSIYNASNQFNVNMYFAILNASGNLIFGPINLTYNSAWGSGYDDNVPQIYDPTISATGDGRFIIAWYKYHFIGGEPLSDIYYTVRGSDGSEVRPVTKFTFDTPGTNEAYYGPNLTSIRSDRILLTWNRFIEYATETYYAVLNNVGDLIYPATNLTKDGQEWGNVYSDAIQLSDGKILIAWASRWNFPGATYQICFAILDAAYNRTFGPSALLNPIALSGNMFVSVTSDLHGNAVLTWMDYDDNFRRNLYYALVNGNGEVVTEPMIFRSAALSEWGDYNIETSYLGYGNTTYRSYDLIYDTYLPITGR